MQLFELVSPRLFRPLAGPNRAFYAELLLLLWEECRHTADYSISRAEAVSRAEDYFAALAKPLALDADGAGDEDEQPTRDPHTLAVGFLLRLRRTGWLEEQPGSYESEPTLAFMPEVTPLLDALEEILNPRVVTYTGKLYKAWQLLGSIGQEKSPYENVLREVAADLETLNKSLRALNASIGHYIDRLTHNRTPQEVLELFDQYEEKVVAAAYHRFKTSDNLFNYRAYLEEELDDCEQNQLPRLALDYARVEHCAPGEAAPRVRALIQQQRDALEEMSTLMKEIDASHIRYRKRAVQRAQFLLLSDRSAQGSVTALLRRYAEDIRSPEQLFEPDDGPVAARLHLYPAAVFGAKPLYPPAAPRTEAPLAPVRTEPLDPDRLRQEQQLLLDYARLAVTEENVALLAQQALAARGQVNASTLVEEYPGDFTGIIGLHTYSQSPHREYDITLTGNWVERGGFRFQDFVLTRRKEVNTDGNHRSAGRDRKLSAQPLLCAGLRRGTAGKISVYSGSPQRGAGGVQTAGLRGAFVPRTHAGGGAGQRARGQSGTAAQVREHPAAGAAAFVPAKAGKPCRQRRRGAGDRRRSTGRIAKDEPAPQAGSANAGKAHAHPAPVQSGASCGTALRAGQPH